MGLIELWINALTKPQETFAAEKQNASIAGGMKQFAIVYGIIGFLVGLFVALVAAVFPLPKEVEFLKLFGLAAIIAVPIVAIILGIIATLINSLIYFVFSKIFGGTGSFTQQYYLYALFSAPLSLVTLLLFAIPFLGWLIALLLALYSLCLLTLSLKEAHGYETWKAVASWLVPVIIIILIVLAFATPNLPPYRGPGSI
jgi:hypothetical protein